MKFPIRLIVLLLPTAFLVSCSYLSPNAQIQNRDKTYLKAQSIPPLRIPPGVGSSAIENSYPVSYRQYPVSEEDVNLLPPGLLDK